MRMKFQEQLDELTDQLASMCHLAGQALVGGSVSRLRRSLSRLRRSKIFQNPGVSLALGSCPAPDPAPKRPSKIDTYLT